MPEDADFGRRLRHARLDRGLSQRALCRGICSNATLSRWEAGRSRPGPGQIVALARRLGITPEVLSGARFEPRLAMSETALPELLDALIAVPPAGRRVPPTAGGEPVAGWVGLLRATPAAVDPWGEPEPALAERLIAHPVTMMSTETLQAAVLLHAQAGLCHVVTAEALAEASGALHDTADAPAPLRARALETVAFLAGAHGGPGAAREVLRDHPAVPRTPASTLLSERVGAVSAPPARPVTARDAILSAVLTGTPVAAAMEVAVHADVLAADWLPVFGEVPDALREAHAAGRPAVPAPVPGPGW